MNISFTQISSKRGRMQEEFQKVSLFPWILSKPTAADFENRREYLEARYDCKLVIYSVDYPIISGKKYTRVMWEARD